MSFPLYALLTQQGSDHIPWFKAMLLNNISCFNKACLGFTIKIRTVSNNTQKIQGIKINVLISKPLPLFLLHTQL